MSIFWDNEITLSENRFHGILIELQRIEEWFGIDEIRNPFGRQEKRSELPPPEVVASGF